MIQPDTPIVISPNQIRHLNINAYPTIQDLQYSLQTDDTPGTIKFTETDGPNGYYLNIECLQPNTSETLHIQMSSPSDDNLSELNPITIPINCLPEDADTPETEAP